MIAKTPKRFNILKMSVKNLLVANDRNSTQTRNSDRVKMCCCLEIYIYILFSKQKILMWVIIGTYIKEHCSRGSRKTL